MSLSGISVDTTTTTIPRFTTVALQKLAGWTEFIKSCAEGKKEDTDIADECIIPLAYAFGASARFLGSYVQRIHDFVRTESYSAKDGFVFVINALTDILYFTEVIIDQCLDIMYDELKKEAGEDSKRLEDIRYYYNIIKSTEYCLNLAFGYAGLIAIYVSAGVSSLSSFSVGPNQVSCNTRKIKESSEHNLTVLSAGAGKVAL